MPRYNPAVIEPKWQKFWDQNRTFACPALPKGRKLYVLDMFPYPSGDGLHVGHPEGYTATDIVCRYQRMRGTSVMHPMGWDAFGLPAEQHAKKTGTHPRTTTDKNIANFRRQLKMLGFSYDWGRELATTDVGYFRWTQFIFLLLFDTWFDPAAQRGRPIAELPIPDDVADEGEEAVERFRDEHRLAYQLDAPVNWCPALGTVLANEEVQGGVSERGGHPVVRIPLRQWMLRITAYADRLERDLDGLDWPESIKILQRNWIGRSTGAEVDFFIGTIVEKDWIVNATFRGSSKVDSVNLATVEQERKPSQREYQGWLADRKLGGWPRKPDEQVLRIYTTRPDTLFGATYMVIAPEHPFVERLTTPAQADAVRAYCQKSASKSDLDRTDLAKEKTGVFTGSYAINPVNGEAIPIWVADYVLISYGTGAIMAVPAHDTRDFEFAKLFDLPIVAVVDPGEGSGDGGQSAVGSRQSAVDDAPPSAIRPPPSSNPQSPIPNPSPRDDLLAGRVAFIADGTVINSGLYNGLTTPEFKKKIAEDLSEKGLGRSAVNYKLRDWLFSRQHFWGEPFPILHELDSDGNPTGRIRALDPSELPLDLPARMQFDAKHDEPTPPLDKAPSSWLYVLRDGKRYKRETNTMPQWAGSCWYYLRFLDPKNANAPVDPQIEKAWMPVDLYVGGAEHAVLHLLYARFWHKVLFDRGYVGGQEPFQKLVNQGMILGENNEKMSKSRDNVVNPDDVVHEYGADALRLYEMFMGPLESVKPWSMDGVSGVRGFLDRAWRMIIDDRAESMQLNAAVQPVEPTAEQNRMLHKTIKAVTNDLEQLSFNTAIARMMEFVNFFLKSEVRPKSAMQQFVLLLSPFAPHLAEELWQALRPPLARSGRGAGGEGSELPTLPSPLGRWAGGEGPSGQTTLAYESWPTFDESAIREETIEIPIQINGKLRWRIQVPAAIDQPALEAAARADAKVAELLAGKTVIKAIVVPGRLVNFVVK
ncbi:MAG: class I tRNA ligase family protein [Thermoguttaceae bacterium]